MADKSNLATRTAPVPPHRPVRDRISTESTPPVRWRATPGTCRTDRSASGAAWWPSGMFCLQYKITDKIRFTPPATSDPRTLTLHAAAADGEDQHENRKRTHIRCPSECFIIHIVCASHKTRNTTASEHVPRTNDLPGSLAVREKRSTAHRARSLAAIDCDRTLGAPHTSVSVRCIVSCVPGRELLIIVMQIAHAPAVDLINSMYY